MGYQQRVVSMAEKENDLNTKTVRVRNDLFRMMRTVTANTDQSMVDYLDRLLRESVERDYREVVRRLASEQGEK
mgnify:CR=1 FL=1